YQTALDDWLQIRSALAVLESRLGPSFHPLSAEYHQPLPTPFGTALQYRSYDIGIIWALLHMAHIISIRSHPAMPPASMMAAGVAAAATAGHANEIGRIAAGIVTASPGEPLNPSLGAALIESTMPLFFAGVQYQDRAQREWLVSRILDIEARTGWGSAGLIARGCEAAWERAAAAGRGPPYKSQRNETREDERLSGRKMGGEGDGSGGNGEGVGGARESPRELVDRRFVMTCPGTRVHWAMGLLAAEEDLLRERGGLPKVGLVSWDGGVVVEGGEVN
ncbi:hypothetical protein K432DRAFT_399236, partial [Lepidopterella palustris CBS 459.81]